MLFGVLQRYAMQTISASVGNKALRFFTNQPFYKSKFLSPLLFLEKCGVEKTIKQLFMLMIFVNNLDKAFDLKRKTMQRYTFLKLKLFVKSENLF